MRVRHRSFLVVLGLGVAMSASSAPNLLSNSHFDTDLSGWIVVNDSFSQMTFDATLDANSSLTSGSAKFSKTAGMSCVPNLYQCVGGLTPGKPYDFGGSVYIPGGQPAKPTRSSPWSSSPERPAPGAESSPRPQDRC